VPPPPDHSDPSARGAAAAPAGARGGPTPAAAGWGRSWSVPEAPPDDPDAAIGARPGSAPSSGSSARSSPGAVPMGAVPMGATAPVGVAARRPWRHGGRAARVQALREGIDEAAAAAVDGPAPPVPVALAPLTIADMLDGAWAVLSCRPAVVFALTALLVLPAELLAAYLVRDLSSPGTVGAALTLPVMALVADSSDSVPLAVVAGVVLSLAYALLGGAMGYVVAGWYDGRDVRVGEALRATARRLPALLAAWTLLLVPKGLGLASCGLLYAFLFPFVLLVSPVIVIERRGPLAGIRRSVQLVARRYLAVLFVWWLSVFVERLVSVALAIVPELLATVAPPVVADALRPSGWAFAMFITAPVVAALPVLIYQDLRVRTEGVDLDGEVAGAFPAR
jgi:hypothetical protein